MTTVTVFDVEGRNAFGSAGEYTAVRACVPLASDATWMAKP